jgi:hypothetical protein
MIIESLKKFSFAIKNILLLFISLVTVALLSEFILRHFYPVISYAYPQNYFISDKELGFDIDINVPIASHNLAWEGLEYDIWSNNQGCFDNPLNKADNYYLIVGDSFSWGYSKFENKWGYLLEKKLDKRVLKCGVTGYETKGELIKTKKILSKVDRKPEKIIVGYYVGNDVRDRYLFPYRTVYDGYLINIKNISNSNGEIKTKSDEDIAAQYNNYRHIRSAKGLGNIEYWLLQHSTIYGMYHRLRYPMEVKSHESTPILSGAKRSVSIDESLIYRIQLKPWEEKAWETHLNDIESFARYAKMIESEVVFILIPAKAQVYSFLQKEGIDYSRPNKFLLNFFNEKNIKSFDLLDTFVEQASKQSIETLIDGEGYYYAVDGHWNKKGNRLAADAIYQYLKNN